MSAEKKHVRWKWLLDRARAERFIDVLNAGVVRDYIAQFEAPHQPTCWGAWKCPQMGADLGAMAKLGFLKRAATGLSGGAWQPGFPKWVWSYQPGPGAATLDAWTAPPT